jgi:hypothetical protein
MPNRRIYRKLAGDLYLPDDLARGEKRAGIVL